LNEEQVALRFIEEYCQVCKRDDEAFKIYFDFLLKITQYAGEPHTESVVRSVIQSITSIVIKGLPPKHLESILSKLLDRMQ
jgi:hypothetical protein